MPVSNGFIVNVDSDTPITLIPDPSGGDGQVQAQQIIVTWSDGSQTIYTYDPNSADFDLANQTLLGYAQDGLTYNTIIELDPNLGLPEDITGLDIGLPDDPSGTDGTGLEFPFQQFLKEFPQGVFEDFTTNRTGLSSFQSGLLGNEFTDFATQFQGELAEGARNSELPSQTFTQFLEGLDFNEEFFSRFADPASRGIQNRNAFTRFQL